MSREIGVGPSGIPTPGQRQADLRHSKLPFQKLCPHFSTLQRAGPDVAGLSKRVVPSPEDESQTTGKKSLLRPATLNDSNCQQPQRGNHILKTWDLVTPLWKFFVSSGRKLHMSRQECSLACEGLSFDPH
jgi:hypothetical protein